MARRDLSHTDASTRAASELEYVIRREKRIQEPEIKTISAEEAMREERVYKVSSDRNITRVLFISQNTELLNPTQQSLDGYVNISDLFDEVHILIMRQGIPPKNPVLRVASNVWLYTVSTKYWWQKPKAGLKMIEEQLVFAEGFRPDLIVARDPFESAILAAKVSKKYNHASQLHILDDYTTTDFLKRSPSNFWRRFIPRFTIPKFASVRTQTSTLQTFLQKKFTIPDIDLLPRFQNYEGLIDLPTELDLKEKYKSFVFIIIFVGKLSHESTLYRAIDAARFVLRNPRVGMLVLGDGPARPEFQKRTRLLGIEDQVVFETKAVDLISYLKSSNMMIVTDTDVDSEELVLKGAAAGVPMVMSRTEKREDIFTHGESAFLCDGADIQALTDRIDDMLNDFGLRKQFIKEGQDMIKEKFHSDPDAYREAYRTSIEQAFFVETDEEKVSEESEE